MLKNRIRNLAKNGMIAVLVISGMAVPAVWRTVLADTMTSASYKIEADTLSIGGNRSTTASYTIEDTIGEMSTGQDLSSAGFRACSGYQCFMGESYISFSVKEGTVAPGSVGVGVDLGEFSVSAVSGSNGTSVNSIFVSAETNASGGSVITVRDANGGLQSASNPAAEITSATASLVAGTEGYGLCVQSATESAESPSNFDVDAPYASACDKTSGHSVGLVDATDRTILDSNAELAGGEAEILVKSAVSTVTPAAVDYRDTLTFIFTATF